MPPTLAGSLASWHALLSACEARSVDPALVVHPQNYRDDLSALRRAAVLRTMHVSHGVSVESLTLICPYSPASLRRIVHAAKDLGLVMVPVAQSQPPEICAQSDNGAQDLNMRATDKNAARRPSKPDIRAGTSERLKSAPFPQNS